MHCTHADSAVPDPELLDRLESHLNLRPGLKSMAVGMANFLLGRCDPIYNPSVEAEQLELVAAVVRRLAPDVETTSELAGLLLHA